MECTMIFKLFLFFAFLQVVSGVKIESVQLFQHELVAREGQRLLIPCSFSVDDPANDHQIELEWSMMPKGGDIFRPIMRLDDTRAQLVSHPNERAWMNLLRVRKGHCSLVIDPVKPEDSGTYQVRLAINGIEYVGALRTNVRVLQSRGVSDLHSEDTDSDQPMITEAIQQTATQDEDPDTMRMEEVIQALKDKGLLLYLEIGGGVLIAFLILCSLAAICFGCLYCHMGRKIKDAVKMMEEGTPTEQASVTSDVAVDLSAVTEPPIEVSSGIQWVLTAVEPLPQTPINPSDSFNSDKYLRGVRPRMPV